MQVLETMPPGYAIIYRDLSAGQVVNIRTSGRVAISSPGGVQVQAGEDVGTQVLAAWYDPWARPRAVLFTGIITVTGTSWIAICAAVDVSGANYTPGGGGLGAIVSVDNFPANQVVTVDNPTTTVSIDNFPVNQEISGTITVNYPTSQTLVDLTVANPIIGSITGNAATATTATTADTATLADNATTADYATAAGTATTSGSASSATFATGSGQLELASFPNVLPSGININTMSGGPFASSGALNCSGMDASVIAAVATYDPTLVQTTVVGVFFDATGKLHFVFAGPSGIGGQAYYIQSIGSAAQTLP